ncbi:metal ABC transporter ATP-binding protein [Candidatus Contubernalis alkaliaceticus]|uniref:metal ABC transporter ATP-binding protein n=1 Tax=Candidatus Contubernalis alkaliaceticus TaxID=338645 RepID=UPI001F4C1243|nr:ABC transporter ATP-binding protein [Candidatus Contubernalis alkalaceticus]UNC93086.1 ABC transporter ATP-binding protein [Candidatus Contubernalis alkalaceticus]
MDNIIEVKNLYVYYNNHCALEDINLEVKQNDFLGLIGPNGAGKSTLLKVLLGLVTPGHGKVKIFGESPQKVRGRLGYVPQHVNFDKRFPIKVMDVVSMGRINKSSSIFNRYSRADLTLVDTILQKLDIGFLRNRQIGQLSGGELQRVLIARALVAEPDILLLDEPTASVDANSKSQIYSILQSLNNDNMTIILVTHDIGVISSHVKTIACLNVNMYYHGEAEFSGDVIEQIYGCPVELVAHGFPHRVLKPHGEGEHV